MQSYQGTNEIVIPVLIKSSRFLLLWKENQKNTMLDSTQVSNYT